VLPAHARAARTLPPFPTRRSSDLEIRSHEAAGFPHRLNLVTSCDEVADGRQGGTGLRRGQDDRAAFYPPDGTDTADFADGGRGRSEEHTSELQSRFDLVCRLLLEK